tara:strand:- start:935 stop:1060 length:126 start_codon:yes stop_codon:yes gene_type:complete
MGNKEYSRVLQTQVYMVKRGLEYTIDTLIGEGIKTKDKVRI